MRTGWQHLSPGRKRMTLMNSSIVCTEHTFSLMKGAECPVTFGFFLVTSSLELYTASAECGVAVDAAPTTRGSIQNDMSQPRSLESRSTESSSAGTVDIVVASDRAMQSRNSSRMGDLDTVGCGRHSRDEVCQALPCNHPARRLPSTAARPLLLYTTSCRQRSSG